MISSCNDSDQNQSWVCHPQNEVPDLPKSPNTHRIPVSDADADAPENARVQDKRGPDHEGVSEMHARHGCKVVHEFTAHPDTLGVVSTNSIDEPVFLRK